ncbi:hypothetical protein CQ12_19480 [Bradyrhizobium jicamae]|uniref:DUF1236 domain-containing protein n=2 Tax=Bradyrhizobium jicamae TaxID=280332 RepID=A0A0R3LSN2_9BRAD|nr:hypothetical protein CQ12_19480 [Bradyrhizobium jicamae]
MLAPAVSYGQSPGARGEEQKQTRPSDSGKGAASQERGQAAEQKAQGGREERGAGSRQTEERGKAAPSSERPAAAADDSKRGRGDDARSSDRAQDSRNRDGKDAKDSKGSAEMKRDSDREKSRAESDKGKEGTTSAQKEREGTTTTQKESGRDQRDSSKNAAEQGKDTSKDANRPSTATDTTRTQPSTNTQTGQSQTGQTQTGQQSNISVEKQTRISQTLTRERLSQPERNLNIAIRVGEPIPQRVRVYRVPDTIVAIEPEYRGYDYFTTEEEIVIVEPRTRRIVSQVPRDASRIRAAGGASGTAGTSGTSSSGSYTGTVAAAGGASPCRIMRRDTAGNVTELTPQTVGSAAAQQETISVTVRVPGGASTAPIALGAADGQIVVSGQSGADCMVTIEPQTR